MPDASRRKKLTRAHKQFILRCLAVGLGPQDVADAVKDEFDIEITRQNVDYYIDKYPEEIEQLRKKIAADIEQVPFARKMVRVGHLDRIAKKMYKRKNWAEFRATCRQIADEMEFLEGSEPNTDDDEPMELEELEGLDAKELIQMYSKARLRAKDSP